MSDSPLLSKMDALLKKHRGGGDRRTTAPAAPPRRETAAARRLAAGADRCDRARHAARGRSGARHRCSAAAPAFAPPRGRSRSARSRCLCAIVSDALAEQLLGELAPRLSEVMEKQVAAELRKNLDQTVATLLSQLDVNVREIVRDAVAEKLKQPRDPSSLKPRLAAAFLS
jgi:BMFP domain-containing protein YqiC